MKTKVIAAVAAGIITLGATCMFVTSNDTNDLVESNIEALAETESIYDQYIWVVYHRDDGGFNCTRGGIEKC